jgi:hypothetical protein
VELGDVVLQIHFYRIISEKIVRSLDAGQLMGVPFICGALYLRYPSQRLEKINHP